MDGAGAQSADDPGNVFNTATDLPTGCSLAGNSSPVSTGNLQAGPVRRIGTDRRLDLHRQRGGCCCNDLDSTDNPPVSNDTSRIRGRYFNFHLRRNFPSGVYYVLVRSYHTGSRDCAVVGRGGNGAWQRHRHDKALETGRADPRNDRPGKRRRLLPAGFY